MYEAGFVGLLGSTHPVCVSFSMGRSMLENNSQWAAVVDPVSAPASPPPALDASLAPAPAPPDPALEPPASPGKPPDPVVCALPPDPPALGGGVPRPPSSLEQLAMKVIAPRTDTSWRATLIGCIRIIDIVEISLPARWRGAAREATSGPIMSDDQMSWPGRLCRSSVRSKRGRVAQIMREVAQSVQLRLMPAESCPCDGDTPISTSAWYVYLLQRGVVLVE